MEKKRKKGLSEVISILIIISLTLVAVLAVWVVIRSQIETTKEQVETLNVLGLEQVKIEKALGNFQDGGNVSITITRRLTSVKKTTEKSYKQEITEKKPVDIVLVLDRSGSMKQSGWVFETSLSPINTTTLIVPRDAYSPAYSFSIPSGTERLAFTIEWNEVPGFEGSEGSEFGLNIRRPSGTWVANSVSYPSELGGKVDPPSSVGASNEYYSGVSTKPQCFYIENPSSGTWQAKVYGWNLRPKSTPPPSQNVSLKIYIGDSSSLNKSLTILSSETVKDASKNFVDRLEENDRVAIVRFGSYSELTQTLTTNKIAVKNAIDNLGSEGGTYINTGIDRANQHLVSAGDPNSILIMTILTDGQNDMGPAPVITSAQQAKNNNFTIFTIGLTHFVDEDMLKTIATQPDYYYYSDFDKLDEIYEQLSEKIGGLVEYTKIVGVSLILVFSNDKTSCEKEIEASQVPDALVRKTFIIDLEGCITNITKIEIYPKVEGKIGPLLDTIKVTP